MKCTQCRNEFDELYTFCPYCGKERDPLPTEKVLVSTESAFRIRPIEQEKSAAYEDNIAFLRNYSASSKMLVMILMLSISALFSTFQLIDSILNPIETDTIFGMYSGSPIISSIAFVISVFPLIGLVIVYGQAKRPYALTDSGFDLIRIYALINVWLLRIAGVLLSLSALLLLFSSYAVVLIAFIPLLLAIPHYYLLLATKEFCEMLVYAIKRDESAILPHPDRLQKWLKWMTIEYMMILFLSIFLVYGFEPPTHWSVLIETLSNYIWIWLIQTAIITFAWYFIKEYGYHLWKRKNN
jgi:hypothetical protein